MGFIAEKIKNHFLQNPAEVTVHALRKQQRILPMLRILNRQNLLPPLCTVTSRIHFFTESNRRIVEMEKLCYDTCGYNCSAGLHTSCADLLNSYG